jgi:hypothetical protein
MPGIVPPQIYKGSSGNIQVDGYVSRYFCPPQKMPTTRDEFLSMENTSRLLSELQECPKSCPVEPLADYKGSPGYDRFESGDTVIKDKLTPDMQKKLQCFESAMANASIKGKVNSAWRPEWYQQHFYEMYEKLLKLDEIDNPACNARFAEIDAHAAKHGIARFNKGGDRTPVGKPEKSNHPQGVAFDFTWRPKKSPNRVLDAKVDALASSCGLYRPYPDNDWMHFESK